MSDSGTRHRRAHRKQGPWWRESARCPWAACCAQYLPPHSRTEDGRDDPTSAIRISRAARLDRSDQRNYRVFPTLVLSSRARHRVSACRRIRCDAAFENARGADGIGIPLA
jgi:hypothetical protein